MFPKLFNPSRSNLVFVVLLTFAAALPLIAWPAIECPGSWRLITSAGPSDRFGPVMAYDATRRQVVLFGGSDLQSNRFGDTWVWDGTVWIQAANTGPNPRAHAAMDFNFLRSRVVLFGGIGTPGDRHKDNADTWEWDGSTWIQLAATGPAARNAHGLAFDSIRKQTVLFGGSIVFVGTVFQDTWELQSNTWTQRFPATAPDMRGGFGMSFDSWRGRTVLFGGNFCCPGKVFGDTWEWDGTSWIKVATAGPSARSAISMAYDSARRRIVLFGGANGGFYGDTWEWDGVSWTQVASVGPSPRGAGSIAYDRARGKSVIFGGIAANGSLLKETWEWVGPIYSCINRAAGDLNCDHRVDHDDLTILVASLNTAAFGSTDPRDLNHDGQIKADDAQQLALSCTNLGCKAH